ncbi:MAG: hypothetical protein RXO33_02745 [Nitrososphaeria archaeon]
MQGVSTRSVQQLYHEYKSTGVIHVHKKAKRHYSFCLSKLNVKPKLYKMYRANASYIGKILRAKGYSIDNDRINQVLKEAGFVISNTDRSG